VKTFARCPLVGDPDGVDVAVLGIPFDTATTNRPGARFGPEAVRAASVALRPYNALQRAQVFGALSVADLGDVRVTPGNAERTVGQIAEQLAPIVAAGARTLCLGGDHLVVLGELRAHAEVHGPLGLVLLDAHADVWDTYCGERYYHGSPFRRAVEEGLLDPSRSFLAGMRGPVYGPDDSGMPRELGFEAISCEALVALSPEEYGAHVRERAGEGPLFLSFDVDVLDPAFAPGTGTPEAGGLTTREALAYVRALRGLAFTGFDVVEVSPPYDGPGQPTAVAAANIAFELLTLDVLAAR
jgi:agmatinase